MERCHQQRKVPREQSRPHTIKRNIARAALGTRRLVDRAFFRGTKHWSASFETHIYAYLEACQARFCTFFWQKKHACYDTPPPKKKETRDYFLQRRAFHHHHHHHHQSWLPGMREVAIKSRSSSIFLFAMGYRTNDLWVARALYFRR